MKRILFLVPLLLWACCGTCKAQMMPDSTVQIVAYWSLGEKYNYQVEEEKGVISGADTTIVEKSAEILTMEVVDETDSTYTLKISYDDFQHSDYARMAANEAIEKIYGKTWFLVVTDTYGSFLRVEVPDEYTQAGHTAISETINSMADENDLPEEGRQAVESMMKALLTPDAFTLAAMGEIAPMLFFHGARFSLPDEYEYEEDMLGLLGDGGTIRTTGRIWVDERYSDEESVVMRIFREADPESTKPYILSVFASMLQPFVEGGGELDKDGLEELYSQFGIAMEDYVVEEIHLGSGWPLYYRQTRYVDILQDDEVISEQYVMRSVDIIL